MNQTKKNIVQVIAKNTAISTKDSAILLDFFLILFITLFSFNAVSKEVVTDFNARIDVLDNGDILVKETIQVNVENNRIRHGIYRSTPTVFFGVFFTHKKCPPKRASIHSA